MTTPSTEPLPHQLEQEQPLSMSDFARFRGQAACANYLGPDRPDVIYAAKEVSRGMSSPTELHQAALKRMVRYLRSRLRMVFKFSYESATPIDTYADTDWAGCPRSRRTTSGGCIMVGTHLLKCWSATQAGVAMSSGKAEFQRGEHRPRMKSLYRDIG